MTETETSVADSAQITVPAESTSRTWRLARKELREILRDRRTVITLVLMPLLVYPLLGVIMRKGVLSNLSLEKIKVHIVLQTEEDVQIFMTLIGRANRIRSARNPEKAPLFGDGSESADELALGKDRQLSYKIFSLDELDVDENLERYVSEGYADLAVRLVPDPTRESQVQSGEPFVEWEFIHAENSSLGKRATNELTECFDASNDAYTDELLIRNQLPRDKPAVMKSTILPARDTGPSPLITFIPLALVLMTMTGAVYPAIDLTAGERERGTMEILVSAPVSRMTLLAGKFLAVLVVALMTASMNLISMFATLFALGLQGKFLGNVGPTMIIQVVVLMVVFAAFFSAVLLSITSVARSFKEAQAYLIPLMLISLTPGVFSLMPDLNINGLLAVTPLVNTVLMGRDLLLGEVNILMFAIVLISTVLYGVFALAVAARIFGSDAVLYGSGGTWTELLKRPAEPQPVASISTAMSCLAAVFSLFIVFGSVPWRLDISPQNQAVAAGLTAFVLFVIVPTIGARLTRVELLSGFSIRKAPWGTWCAALLLGGSLWVFLYEMQIRLLTDDWIELLKERFAGVESRFQNIPFWAKLFALAIAPAVCEELFFRGFLQNAIRRQATARMAVLSTAIIFGLFHVIAMEGLMLERLLPSTLLGIVLGIVFERSGSVLPGMLLHLANNGFLVSVSEYKDDLSKMGIGASLEQHLPNMWLVYAGVAVVLAVLLLSRRKPESPVI